MGAGMDDTQPAASVLRRKAGAGRNDAAQADEPAPNAALRRAFARAAQAEMRLALVVTGVSSAVLSLAELLEQPEPCSLLAVLEGPNEVLGLLAIGPEVLAAIVQVQTTGQVRPVAGPPRRPTRTDAAMCAGLIDRTLGEFETALAGTPDLGWAGGYRYASFLNEARPLGLLLEDVAFRLLRVDVMAAGETVRGQALLAVPADGRRRRAGAPGGSLSGPGRRESDRGAAQAQASWAAQLEAAVLGCPADLRAVLHRLRVPLSELSGWTPGLLLPLPLARLDEVRLEAAGKVQVCAAHLGKSRGFRALRLRTDPDRVEAQQPDAATGT